MNKYTIKKAAKLGDYDQKYGQRFWAEVEEAQMPVSFNLMNSNVSEIQAGMPIEFDERKMKTSAKGNDYMHLTKVKLMGAPLLGPQTASSDSEVIKKLDEILAILKADSKVAEKIADTVVEDIGDEPINLEDIPF